MEAAAQGSEEDEEATAHMLSSAGSSGVLRGSQHTVIIIAIVGIK